MRQPNAQNIGYLKKFATALEHFKVGQFNTSEHTDAFDIIKDFRSIAGEEALKFLDDSNSSARHLNNDWEQEARLWHLLDLLMSFRTADHDTDRISIENYNSNALFEKQLLQDDKKLYQIWIIMVWLQENMTIQERPDNLPTSKWTQTLISGNLESADLDYPLRNVGVTIEQKDKEQDHIFFQYIYHLLLAGKYEEAFEECKLSENLTLNMILCGIQEYVNPAIDTQIANEFEMQQGVKKHALWRRAVYNLSQCPDLNPYERAIYNYLSGTIPDTGIDANWDSDFLLQLNQILQIEIENYLLKNGKINAEELITPLPMYAKSLDKILNSLSERYPMESESPMKVLMGAIILDTLPSVLHSSVEMLLDIIKGKESSNDLLDEPYLLRVVTHLSIFIDVITPGAVPKGDKYKLVTAYISILKMHGYYDCIPIYISFLEDDEILNAYSFVLSTMNEPELRQNQLELMKFLRLPVTNILKKTTSRVFTETEPEYTPDEEISVSFGITDTDKHLILAVEWLLQGKLFTDALESVLALSRRFLINGKVKALDYFFRRNSMDDLLKAYKLEIISQRDSDEGPELKIEELLQYENLIHGLNRYEEWNKTIKLLNSESNIPSLIEKFQAYTRSTHDLIENFLVNLSRDEGYTGRDIIYEIRALYTPYLIIELHKGLVEAAKLLKIPKFISEALNYTDLVANETDKIYLLFQTSGKLKEYLQLVAHTATLVDYSKQNY
ncbi:hypothetical protein NCAS_0B06030 [Naumovozyma castellii]|uniref:Nuclear pore complex protein n=1 Tax=Naumovozyma castellii TaxID=27288 RepID=G0V9S0_NAUCA|nr:hypothetical protein NCAS_0B06030 [Naumovozyma castellii CBS 4309]CCC68687.1 hypothetical protein NCAS_0B06030 [Naumovozyma castellii CBS 4309]